MRAFSMCPLLHVYTTHDLVVKIPLRIHSKYKAHWKSRHLPPSVLLSSTHTQSPQISSRSKLITVLMFRITARASRKVAYRPSRYAIDILYRVNRLISGEMKRVVSCCFGPGFGPADSRYKIWWTVINFRWLEICGLPVWEVLLWLSLMCPYVGKSPHHTSSLVCMSLQSNVLYYFDQRTGDYRFRSRIRVSGQNL